MLDFPPRLNIEPGLQEQLRQEYHRVAARMGKFDSNLTFERIINVLLKVALW